jgi:hypothetical protein
MVVATRHPRTDDADAIDVVRVAGATADGVNQAEVGAVLAAVRGLAATGQTGVGVVSPFRAQADALECALLDEFPLAEIERLGLRVGTVHAFQGSEAEVVVASFAVTPGDPAGRFRLLADPHLFNVLITRARQRLVVVTSLAAADARGLVGDFLRYADAPPPAGAPAVDPTTSRWRDALAVELARLGVPARPDYQVGAWRLDLCVGPAPVAIGLTCGVHPAGVAAHVEREQALRRAGWQLRDVFASRWAGDPVRAALEVAATIGASGTVTTQIGA